MNSSRILVCLYSDANYLSLNLLEILLSKNCQVVVVTADLKKWGERTSHLINRTRFSIIDEKKISEVPPFNYSIFCGGFISKEDSYKTLKKFLSFKSLNSSKRLAILPFEAFSPKDDGLINLSSNLSVIYMGDLIGPRIDLESDLLVNRVIGEVITKGQMVLAVGEVFYPVFVSDAAREVAKWLFSFGPYGQEIFLLGTQVSGTNFWSVNRKIIGEIKLDYDNKREPRYIPKNYTVETLNTNLNLALTETYRWLSRINIAGIASPKANRKAIQTKALPRFFWPIAWGGIFIIAFPFLMILGSLGLTYWSYRDFVTGNAENATSKVLIAKTLLVIGHTQSAAFSYIPLAGRIYKEAEFMTRVGQTFSDAEATAIPVIQTANETFNKVLGDSIYDLTVPSQQISSGMNLIFNDVTTIQTEALVAKSSGLLSAKLLLSKVNFDKAKTFFGQGGALAGNLPSLLGKDQRKTYLLLFQNNIELRPTGGFIGSFGILTFDGGRMTDLTVNDVYSADGQLKGHVEPPTPIRIYLNEANWWLRDSNWDPDFPTSAKRAEWFLDKEVDTQVDGVVAIDLKPVSDMLKTTGPIFLSDYNLDITSDNLYEKTQAEAQEEFFPGSRNKASFLTTLSRNLITEVEKLGNRQKLLVLKSFITGFEDRHIQTFLHDDSSQTAVSSLGWGGEVSQPTCGDNCYADLVGIVEANVGDNKANYFISRNISLEVNLGKDAITRKLVAALGNSANPALGPSGIYKVYLRTFIPSDSSLTSAIATSGENEETLTPEVVDSHGRQEVGVYLQVIAGQTKSVEFTWVTRKLDAPSMSTYGLYIRKQAGVTDDPWRIRVTPENSALTKDGVYTYNTVLARDFFARFGN